MPSHALSPNTIHFPRHRSKAPSPPYRPPPPLRPRPGDTFWDEDSFSENFEPLPDNFDKYAKGFSTIDGALSLSEAELQALKLVPRARTRATDAKGQDADRRATRSQAAVGQKIEFSLRGSRKPYLKSYGVPMYALLNATEEALRQHIAGATTRVLANVSLRQIRIRFTWPQPTASDQTVVYDEWVRVDDSITRVQLAMLVAAVFNRFVEQQRATELPRDEDKWRLRLDAFYRIWLVKLERVESNVFVADLKYALHDP